MYLIEKLTERDKQRYNQIFTQDAVHQTFTRDSPNYQTSTRDTSYQTLKTNTSHQTSTTDTSHQTLQNNTTTQFFHYSSIQLNLLAEFLLDPLLTNTIIKNYRHILIELLARALIIIQSNSNILIQTKQSNHQKEWWSSTHFETINTQIYPLSSTSNSCFTNIELFIACLSMILPNLPQITPFATHFMQSNQLHLDLIIKSFVLNSSSESVLLN